MKNREWRVVVDDVESWGELIQEGKEMNMDGVRGFCRRVRKTRKNACGRLV